MAQNRRARQGQSTNRFYWLLGGLAIVGIAVIAFIVFRGQAGQAALEPVPVQGAEDPQSLVAKAQGVESGPADAPVKMLVFSDYQCPYCGTFAAQIEPILKTEYVDPGKLQLVYYDFPLGGSHRYSFLAARAARCAGDQNKFWEYHNLLFGKQSEWSFDQNPPVGKLVGYSQEIGINRGQFESCLKSDKFQEIVSANRLLGDRLGVNATPTLIVNSKRVSAEIGLDIKALRELLDAEVGASAPAPVTTTSE